MKLLPPILLLATAVLAALGGCGDAAAPRPDAPRDAAPAADVGDVVRIGFLVQQPDTAWAQLQQKFADQAADDLGFEIIHLPIPDRDAALAAIDRLAEEGAGGFVVSTPDTGLGYELVERARAADLKVLSVEHSLVGANGLPHGVPHIGFDDAKIGTTTAVVLDAAMRARGWRSAHPDTTAVCVLTDDRSGSAHARTRAALAALDAARFPADRVHPTPPPGPGDEPGADAAAVLLRQHPGIRRWGVLGPSDRAVIGALRAFEAAGLPADAAIGVGVSGVSALDEFRREPASGFHASVLLSVRAHGYDAAAALYHWVAQGAKPPAETLTPGRLIDRRNFKRVAREAGME